jgi:hypothetical protein
LLANVIRKAGLKPPTGRIGPRVHDLRHAFVVNRMLSWYREGINPQSRLPYLATYLGHKDVYSTLTYLTITPELLQEASKRFRLLGAGVLGWANARASALLPEAAVQRRMLTQHHQASWPERACLRESRQTLHPSYQRAPLV